MKIKYGQSVAVVPINSTSILSGLAPLKDDIGDKALRDAALENYTRWYGLPRGCSTIKQVIESSAGIAGWAKYDGPAMVEFIEPPIIPKTRSAREITIERAAKKIEKLNSEAS